MEAIVELQVTKYQQQKPENLMQMNSRKNLPTPLWFVEISSFYVCFACWVPHFFVENSNDKCLLSAFCIFASSQARKWQVPAERCL